MLEIISNKQRKFLGLQEIDSNWKKLDIQSPNFHDFNVTIYIDGLNVKKCIISGQKKYKEMQLDEELTKNLDAILPKSENKKTSSLDSIINKTPVGMTILFDAPNISIFNGITQKRFYTNYFEDKSNLNTIEDFKLWVNNWCEHSSENDVAEIEEFSKENKPVTVSYKEGDIFRVKLSKELYGYGKILVSYNEMRKNNEGFWDCFMGTPVVAKLYHILTVSKNVTPAELENLKSFPSELILDTNLLNGEYEIIGNSPVDYENESYPIMYGREFTDKNATYFQKGKTFVKLANTTPLYNNFKFNGVALNIGFDINLMKNCIELDSNAPYYENGPFLVKNDLRNPINANQLTEILNQVNI